jgi:dihydrofolate reductase
MTKIKYNIIVAYCNNYGIGYKNKLPWNFKSDMNYFREKTIGNGNNAVIMGRNTLESLPIKYLKNRTNYCITTQEQKLKNKYTNINFYNCFDKLEKQIKERNYDNIWIIGGQQLYNYYLINNKVNSIYATHINHNYNVDTIFPYNTLNNFYCVERKTTKERGIKLEFLKYNHKS